MISASAKTRKAWLPVAAWMLFIFVVSAIPNLRTRLHWDHALRKTAHVIEYLILGGLLSRAYRESGLQRRLSFVLLAVVTAVAYAMTDEYHQSFVPHRRALRGDVLFDALGASLGAAGYAFAFSDAGT